MKIKKEIGSQTRPFIRIRIAGLYLEIGRTKQIYYNIKELLKAIKKL